MGQGQVGTEGAIAEQVAGGHRAVLRVGRQEVGGPDVLGDGGVFFANPTEQVAGLGMEPVLAIELQGAVDLAGRFERLAAAGMSFRRFR